MSNPSDFEIKNGVLKKYKGTGGDVVIPAGVASVGYASFAGCSSLTSITIPAGVTLIGPQAFSNCYKLTSVTIPEGVKRIGKQAFAHCSSLTNVTIPESVTTIGEFAFWNCSSLTSVTIPDGVVSIGGLAFDGCVSLRNVKFPESLQQIGQSAFSGCRDVTFDAPPAVMESLNSRAMIIKNGVLERYTGPGGNVVIPAEVTEIAGYAFHRCGSLTSVTIPEGVINIGDNAFLECIGLKSVKLPKSVKMIGQRAFEYCRDVSFDAPPAVMELLSNAFFRIQANALQGYFGPGGDVKIPDGVTELKWCAFAHCAWLKSVIIPPSVNHIGTDAFRSCHELESVVFSSTDVTFDNATPFEDCPKLCIFLPESSIHTEGKLPPQLSKACLGMNEDDLAFVLLRQSAKAWKTDGYAAAEKKDPVAVFRKQLDMIREMGKLPSAMASNALDFCMTFGQRIPAETVQEFAELLQEKKCKKQLGVLESDITFKEMLFGKKTSASISGAEQKVKEAMNAEGLTEKTLADKLQLLTGLKPEELPELKDINGVLCKPTILAWLLTAHETNGASNKKWQEMIAISWPKPGIRPEAEKVLKELDPTNVQNVLLNLAFRQQFVFGNFSKLYLLSYPLCRYADEKTMAELCRDAERFCSKTNRDEAPGAWLFRRAAIYNNTRAAMLYADKHKDLEAYAALRGTTAEILRDTVLSEFGLNEKGEKDYDLGSGKLSVRLNTELKLELFDHVAGKTVKSVPKKNTDSDQYEAAKADIDDMKKNIRKVVKARNDLLFQAFLDKKAFDAKTWLAVYTKNPVLNAVARLLVWQQGDTFFTIAGSKLVGSAGQACAISEEPIFVAHPMDMGADEIKAWQMYFTSRGLKQPFAQMWEPVVDRKSVKDDRYKDCMIPFYCFRGREKHGIYVEDYDFHNLIEIRFEGCQAVVNRIDRRRHAIENDDRFEVESIGFKRYSRRVNHIVVYLDKVAVDAMVRRDDVAIAERLEEFTLAQIMGFIQLAQELGSVNVLALLLEYKNAHFADFDPMDEYTLEW